MSGKIPQNFIDDVLNSTCVVKVVSRYVELKKNGSNYSGKCPFHNEKTPSFVVSLNKQFYHCFGCGESGNAITFLMKFNNVSFPAAIENLAQQAGIAMPITNAVDDNIRKKYATLVDLYSKITKEYSSSLSSNEKAKQYLLGRGLNESVITNFVIGYAPASWDTVCSMFRQQRDLLVEAGVVVEGKNSKTYDRFRDRIMFPIINEKSQVVGFGARSTGEEMPKYLNSSESFVFKKSNELYGIKQMLDKSKHPSSIIVVEGYMDVVSLSQFGVHNSVATLGTAVTSMQIKKLLRYTNKIAFCFDGDKAGKSAAWKALLNILPLMHAEIIAKFIFLPEGDDPDSFIRKNKKQGLAAYFKKAVNLPDFLFDVLKKKHPGNDLSSRACFIQEAQQIIGSMPASVFRELLIDKVHEISNFKSSAVTVKSINTKKSSLVNLGFAERFLSLLIQHPKIIPQLRENIVDLPENLKENKLLLQFWHISEDFNENIKTANITELFREQDCYKKIIGLAAFEHLMPEEGVLAEAIGMVKKSVSFMLDAEINEILRRSQQRELEYAEKMQLQELIRRQKSSDPNK